uniref:Peptidase S9A N-terminal domain-containing protein n=1 Tax=Kalanchoe fedtschenkoi TaxID=63787 RepID=A0A7N0UH58_KALFE
MATAIPPPVANKIPHEMELFGDVRIDDYYWLRDDSRSDPEILAYLADENGYADHVMSGTKMLQVQIFNEMRGRVKESDITAPQREGAYYYYKRTLQGKEYAQHCRCPVLNVNDPPSVDDKFPFGDDVVPDEHLILDENVKARDYSFYSIGNFKVSPNNKLVAYTEDVTGNEIYTAHIINAETRDPIEKPLASVTSCIEWAGNDALLYMTLDETLRPYKVWLHKLGTDQSEDICLYEEKDDMFSLDLKASESKKFLFVGSESKCTRFTFYFDVSNPEGGLKILTPRLYGIDTSVSHRGNHFFIIRRSSECWNSEVLACPLDDITATTVLIPHKESVKIQEIQLFSNHLVVLERENGLPKIVSYSLPEVDKPLGNLPGGRAVDFIDPSYSIELMESQFNSSILRFSYSSLKTPFSVYDYDMNSSITVLKKIETVRHLRLHSCFNHV